MFKYGIILLTLIFGLSACSFHRASSQQAMNEETHVTTGSGLEDTPGVDTERPIGGRVAQNMDSSDMLKMSRALDKPIGKSTTWKNLSSGVDYTVTPTQKVVVNGNHLCRKYETTTVSGGSQNSYTGTACITSDGNWHPVS